MRSVESWIATNDDQAIPARVKLRLFTAANGSCVVCTRKVRTGDFQFDHIVALANGGAHAETNLRLVCTGCHKTKTREDVKEKSKVARVAKKHLGLRKAKRTIPGRRFNGEPIPARWRA